MRTLIATVLRIRFCFDSKCKLGIVPYYSDQFADRPDIQAFDRAIDAGQPGTFDKRVVATFMGRFLLKGQRRILELQEIGDLEVTPSAKTRR
jgi:hypothetical protein